MSMDFGLRGWGCLREPRCNAATFAPTFSLNSKASMRAQHPSLPARADTAARANPDSTSPKVALQRYLAHKKQPPPRTLQ
ncbi:hypothetical protein T484DRAFT_1934333 [Baffinella frigidus]|nr:hypothetical protein T484DRAFT_1934333 [Cryptophyta sp. CCMP2293]